MPETQRNSFAARLGVLKSASEDTVALGVLAYVDVCWLEYTLAVVAVPAK
ncbi:MAG: hypothetical protein JO227_12660 [Acetobacteraceae bacterium]|nr:hypothetical protein [Acetobacteraceae bacterium]